MLYLFHVGREAAVVAVVEAQGPLSALLLPAAFQQFRAFFPSGTLQQRPRCCTCVVALRAYYSSVFKLSGESGGHLNTMRGGEACPHPFSYVPSRSDSREGVCTPRLRVLSWHGES